MTQRKTRKYKVEFSEDHQQLQARYGAAIARARNADHAADIVARRLGADAAQLVSGANTRYQTVTGNSRGAEFWIQRAD